MRDKLIELKDKIIVLKEKAIETKSRKIILLLLVSLIAIFLIVKGGTAIYTRLNSKYLECTYESAVSDYSKLKIEEKITNVFVKNKRSKMIHKYIYTILNKDKDTLESMKTDKKMYVSAFDDIKGTSAKYKRNGYKVTTTVTYTLSKMEKNKREELNMYTSQTYDEIKAYYEGFGFTCN